VSLQAAKHLRAGRLAASAPGRLQMEIGEFDPQKFFILGVLDTPCLSLAKIALQREPDFGLSSHK